MIFFHILFNGYALYMKMISQALVVQSRVNIAIIAKCKYFERYTVLANDEETH